MEEISRSIKCGNCRNILETPVLLPCGDSICKKHTIECNGTILCYLCEVEHPIPQKGGFPLNKAIVGVINAKIAALDLGNVHKEAKEKCQQFDELLAQIEQILNDPLNFSYEPIDYLKNVVQLKGEQEIMKITEKMNRIISKLDEHKIECKKSLNEKEYLMKSQNLKFEKEKGRLELDKWLATLNEICVNEEEWKRIKSESEKAIKSFEDKLDYFKIDLFPQKYDEFKSEIEKDFGQFEIDQAFNLRNRVKFDSSIVLKASLQDELLKLCGFEASKHLKLLYRGSVDGFSASAFHAKCDYIPKTLTIIKAVESGFIFGGYTEATWDQPTLTPFSKKDSKAFLFSLVNGEKTPVKINITKGNEDKAIIGNIKFGPLFGFLKGFQNDIHISENSNASKLNTSYLGCCYTLPNYPQGSEKANNFLAGSSKFTVEDIEVFQLLQ